MFSRTSSSAVFCIIIAILCQTRNARALIFSSPEPQTDPLAEPTLSVVRLNRYGQPVHSRELGPKARVCPRYYRKGLSIRCDSVRPVRNAKFFVNGEHVRTEYFEEYYIAGDRKTFVGGPGTGYPRVSTTVVGRWTEYPRLAKVVCKLSDGSAVSALILFRCKL